MTPGQVLSLYKAKEGEGTWLLGGDREESGTGIDTRENERQSEKETEKKNIPPWVRNLQ